MSVKIESCHVVEKAFQHKIKFLELTKQILDSTKIPCKKFQNINPVIKNGIYCSPGILNTFVKTKERTKDKTIILIVCHHGPYPIDLRGGHESAR